MIIKTSIAVLLTCHNRKEKTIKCLNSLFGINSINEYHMDVFLVDDGSTDGTSEVVSQKYPNVTIIRGTGTLFWNQGMRLAWQKAASVKDYDYYFWLNDDTILEPFAISELLECSRSVFSEYKKQVIVTGACRSNDVTYEFSYGGRTDEGPVEPNGEFQMCRYINGNAVLVPRDIYLKVGNLSSDYTHGMGDFDYGLRSIEAGFLCFTTSRYVAICPQNEGHPAWCNPQIPLITRLKLINSPKGLNVKEYVKFRKRFWGRKWIVFALKAYFKAIFPRMYLKLKS